MPLSDNSAPLTPVAEYSPSLPAEAESSRKSQSQQLSLDHHGYEDNDEDDIEDDIEGLLWDGQAALIAHQFELAITLYSKAALPPFRSPLACLALGNLISRGSGHRSAPTSPVDGTKTFDFSTNPKSENAPTTPIETPSILSRITDYFGWSPQSPSISSSPEDVKVPIRRTLVAEGWSIPKDGKRAHRDVQGMGIAAGWLLLGLAWAIERNKLDQKSVTSGSRSEVLQPAAKCSIESSAIVFNTNGKGKEVDREVSGDESRASSSTGKGEARNTSSSSSSDVSSKSSRRGSSTAPTSESIGSDANVLYKPKKGSEAEVDQLIYDLLRPLLHLYRHGQIQAHDPVFLPPIPQGELPSLLKASGDADKRRNAWILGGVVAKIIRDSLPAPGPALDNVSKKQRRQLKKANLIITSYILGMTAPHGQKVDYFKTILEAGHSNLAEADDLIASAGQRLDALNGKSSGVTAYLAKAKAARQGQAGSGHQRMTSGRSERPARLSRKGSYASFTSSLANGIQPSPIRNATSSASLVLDDHPEMVENQSGSALDTLRRFGALNMSHSRGAPSRESLEQADAQITPSAQSPVDLLSPEAQAPNSSKGYPQLHISKSSPVLSSFYASMEPTSGARRTTSSAFLTPDQANIAPIDKCLADAELASALTKQVSCSVCGAQGVNFPECRKCGLHFCSRQCRIGEHGAGDGKKHHCGLWESRSKGQVLQPAQQRASPSVVVH
ncbi:hypothetical protein BD324DRAFT_633004 [Kockovaella imperatae]|uniref:Uncharacterized protein n=1 Tax=Kockovaella imperatae TaxID=4999 RepID=A0A1Y1UBT3_9TREE|nr:hypothetical protein BD324DRAFT_633004 [Kockovaella imperatae]ORX35479.1 hypothetical protein BD324DRAFT_633004 [Kockovaella imperatae]